MNRHNPVELGENGGTGFAVAPEAASAAYVPGARRPIGEGFRATGRGVVGWSVRRGVSADAISYLSMVAAAGAAGCLLYSQRSPWLLLVVPAFCYLRLWMNMLDGMVAMAAGSASRRGEILNELPDRISDVMILLAIAHSGWVTWPALGYGAAIGAVMTAYVGMLGQAVGARREFGGWMAKPMRMVIVHAGAWGALAGWIWGWGKLGRLTVMDWACIVIIAGCAQTAAVRLARTLRMLKTQGTNGHGIELKPADLKRSAAQLRRGESNGAADPDDGAEARTFRTHDGVELFYRAWAPAGGVTGRAVMLFHRGHEHSGRWAETVGRLRDQLGKDVAVFAWDQRGHGRSPGERGSAPTVSAIVRDAEEWGRHLTREHGARMEDVVVVGHSVGAVIALAWVHDYAPPVRGLVLATPAMEVKLYVPFAAEMLRIKEKLIGPGYVKSYVRAAVLTHDPAEQEAYNADPLIFRQIAVNVLLGLRDLSKRLIADAGAIRTPTLILAAEKDWVVKHGAQRRLFEGLSSPVKQMESLGGMYHALFHEAGRAAVVERIGRFAAECFDRPNDIETDAGRRALIEADRGGYTRTEYDRLRGPGGIKWKMARGFLKTVAKLSEGVRLGWRTGFDSGLTLDYVYANRARGRLVLGKLIDRNYLNAIGWRGIRIRRVHLEAALRRVMGELRAADRPVRVLDVAAGPGRYVIETLAKAREWGIDARAILRDYKEENLIAARELAASMGLSDRVGVEWGDATDREGVAGVRFGGAEKIHPIREEKIHRRDAEGAEADAEKMGENCADEDRATGVKATIAVVSGLYELFPENRPVRESLAGVAGAVEAGGYLVYTCQPWHPQVEMIARTLTNREGRPWVMRRRTQAEMDALVREAGFEKVSQEMDEWGIFTVSVAKRK